MLDVESPTIAIQMRLDPAVRRLYVLCGLPFSGKSTLARALAERFGWTHVEVDRAHQDRGLDPATLEDADWLQAYRRSYRRAETALAARDTVIWDGVAHRFGHREKLRQLAARHGVATVIIATTTPPSEVERRRAENRLTQLRASVPNESFAEIAGTFEPPTDLEQPLRYDGSGPIDDWLNLTFVVSHPALEAI